MSLKQIIRNKLKSCYEAIGKDIDTNTYEDLIKNIKIATPSSQIEYNKLNNKDPNIIYPIDD